MYRNKKLLTVVAWILIFALAFIPVRRVDAVAPALAPAVYYGIGSLIVATGVYASTNEDLQYLIADYWDNASSNIKYQWNQTVTYGAMVGYMLINQPIISDMKDYLINRKGLVPGQNTIISEYHQVPFIYGEPYDKIIASNGNVYTLVTTPIVNSNNYSLKWYINGTCFFSRTVPTTGAYLYVDSESPHLIICRYPRDLEGNWSWYNPGISIGAVVAAYIANMLSYMVSNSGVGSALAPDDEIKVPCPPVPTSEWPDRWAGDLTEGMTGEGGQVIKGPVEWFKDKDTGKILYFPPGDPPPEYDPEKHEKLVPPLPPIYDPIHPPVGDPGPATPEPVPVPAPEPCPYCPPNPHPLNDPCPNPYCPNNPAPVSPPVPATPGQPVEPCPYCPPNPDPGLDPCPNPYCPNNPAPVSPPYPSSPPVPDDRYLDFDPLKKLPHIFTTKFPFSLPWDLKRGLESLQGGEWDRKFQIAACGEYWPEMEIDISMFDPIAGITRVVFLLVFDFALIFSTRKLMGGDV